MNINKNNPFAEVSGIDAKRKVLRGLSKGAKTIAKMMDIGVNEVLVNGYRDKNHQEFRTFMDWKEKGFMVKKGAKAFCVWSSPLKKEVENKKGEKEEQETGYFGIAHIFSNYQVDKVPTGKK